MQRCAKRTYHSHVSNGRNACFSLRRLASGNALASALPLQLVRNFFNQQHVGGIDCCIETTACGCPAAPPVGVLRGVNIGAARRFDLDLSPDYPVSTACTELGSSRSVKRMHLHPSASRFEAWYMYMQAVVGTWHVCVALLPLCKLIDVKPRDARRSLLHGCLSLRLFPSKTTM